MLIRCNECGNEISDKAETCPHCGYPVNSLENHNTIENSIINDIPVDMDNLLLEFPDKTAAIKRIRELTGCDLKTATKIVEDYLKKSDIAVQSEKKKNSVLSVWAVLISLFGCGFFSIIGAIFAIIDLAAKDNKKHGLSVFAIIFSVLWISLAFFNMGTNDSKTPAPNNSSTEASTIEESTADKKPVTTFETGQIYNENDCIISVTSGDANSIDFCIENNSSKDYEFDIHSLAINGIMTNCNIYTMDTHVPAGKKSNATLKFDKEWLENIDDIEYIDVLFWAYDKAEMFKDYETGIIRIKTNLFSSPASFSPAQSQIDLNGLNISLISLTDTSVTVSVINNNDYYIDYDLKNASINEWAYDTGIQVYDVELFPHSKSIFVIDFDKNFLTKNNINSINLFEFSLDVRVSGDYSQQTETEKITFSK